MTDTKVCETCKEDKSLSEFPAGKRRSGSMYYRPHCYVCKYGKEVLAGRQQDKEYFRSYYYKNKLDFKYKAYAHRDTKFGFVTVEKYKAIGLMMQPCFYCGETHAKGLDRKDSNLGHSEDNVVPCCEKCNIILGDIPFSAKELLIDGLTKIKTQGFLDSWTIPTKRKKQ